ncbi:LuxR C-terminal-related transcriptional regulator [Compostimonas suwonensis]|uniref:ATP/maltotriose-dependent transcriptional regulator MalT n=1 Tax=Compostimonas suwonensis TaxID=1048394 RepID=A0A2M9BB03_9MICO|nr:LuxR C-terminal-related transcriptional regulator [Compostimonas suwonensis]PJJ55123.1 ATP/maltotriose-dependent transcriptional regulator MalT [Compostimonas suwonensis]
MPAVRAADRRADRALGDSGIAYAPHSPKGILDRPALTALIDEAATTPLTVLRAPKGFGKTTALARWVHERSPSTPRRGVWISLGDDGIGRTEFWTLVSTALRDAGLIGVDAGLGAAPRPPDGGLPEGSWLRHTLAGALERLEEPIVIVVDDYHRVGDRMVDDDLLWLLERYRTIRFIVATRVFSVFESLTATARIGIALVDPARLRLSSAEAHQVIERLLPTLTEDERQRLVDELDGWPLALIAVAHVIGRQRVSVDDALSLVAEDVLSDELVGSLLSGTADPEFDLFVLGSALADFVTPELAAALTETPDAASLLARLEHLGFGSWSGDPADRRFEYQGLVLSSLRRRARLVFADSLAERRTRLAEWLESNGYVMDAILQHSLAQHWQNAMAVTVRHASELARADTASACRLLALVPRRDPRFEAELAVIVAVVTSAHPEATGCENTLTSRHLAESVMHALEDAEPVRRAALLFALSRAHREAERYDQARLTAERLGAALAALDTDEMEQLGDLVHFCTREIGLASLAAHRLPVAAEYLLRSSTRARSRGDDAMWLDSAGSLAYAEASLGHVTRARARVAELRSGALPVDLLTGPHAIGLRLAEAVLDLDSFAAESSIAHARWVREAATGTEFAAVASAIETASMSVGGRISAAISRAKALVSATAGAEGTPSPHTREILHSVIVDGLVMSGRVNQADEYLRSRGLRNRLVLSEARLALVERKSWQVITITEPLLRTPDASPRATADALLLRAIAAHRLARADIALSARSDALTALIGSGLRHPLMLIPRAELVTLLEWSPGGDGRAQLASLETVPDRFTAATIVQQLTRRESSVLNELFTTSRAEVIAERLFVSPNTVKSQLRSLYRKLGVSSRDEALIVAADRGLAP